MGSFRAAGVFFDIDKWNPDNGAAGIVGHIFFEVITNKITRGTTNQHDVANKLRERGVDVPGC
jgi:hypothetical protein